MHYDSSIATFHAIERAKSRMGLSKKRALKMIVLAYERGICYEQCRWAVDRKFLESRSCNNYIAKAYNGFCYLFNQISGICITVYELPNDFGKKKTRYNNHKMYHLNIA